jgi:hypothetical protein
METKLPPLYKITTMPVDASKLSNLPMAPGTIIPIASITKFELVKDDSVAARAHSAVDSAGTLSTPTRTRKTISATA